MGILNINKIGQGSKALVLLHGWGFDQRIWHALLPQLSKNFTCYLIDLPGFGQSNLMHWDEFKTQLLNYLPQQFAILGWSLGGLFATKFTIEAPQRITHLVNVTSSPFFVKDIEWPGIERQTLERFFINLSCDPKKTTMEFIALQLKNFPLKNLNFKLSEFSSSEEALTNGLFILANWDLRADLTKLKIQTCYMFGRLDAIVSRQLALRMQELYPYFNYILFQKAAHMPFITHPEEFIYELESFLL
ncbi:biotin operon repressor and biotin [Legionella busanensis]|uniref:Pimeloyl-[acyl-carrier protein] methyl ester esterase n=1 Tax=Legionella busanensis TaxID=190655 RepID=A0A378JJI6_9GAMM|nr:alpha/beta fold hydrolase [Legionella busanensis]STX51375.1 biotin operon repressor and biotin [Legionella busanensis]